jgi:ATP-dependent RNA helicase DDX51/DBP6
VLLYTPVAEAYWLLFCFVVTVLLSRCLLRLYLLLAAVPGLPGKVAEYSSHVTPAAQAAALSGFKEGRVQTLVTSDAMARGMDVSGIACVVNYDPPTYPKTYIHRAGRTARAGSAGAVYSLLKPEDVVHFNSMVRKMQGAKLQQVKLLPAELQELRPALKAALQHVQELVQLEQQQERQQVPEKRKPQPSHQQQQQHVQQHEEQEQQQQQANQERPGSWKQSHNAAHSHHHDADLNVDNGSAAAAASRHKPKKHKKGKLAKQSNP